MRTFISGCVERMWATKSLPPTLPFLSCFPLLSFLRPWCQLWFLSSIFTLAFRWLSVGLVFLAIFTKLLISLLTRTQTSFASQSFLSLVKLGTFQLKLFAFILGNETLTSQPMRQYARAVQKKPGKTCINLWLMMENVSSLLYASLSIFLPQTLQLIQ